MAGLLSSLNAVIQFHSKHTEYAASCVIHTLAQTGLVHSHMILTPNPYFVTWRCYQSSVYPSTKKITFKKEAALRNLGGGLQTQ